MGTITRGLANSITTGGKVVSTSLSGTVQASNVNNESLDSVTAFDSSLGDFVETTASDVSAGPTTKGQLFYNTTDGVLKGVRLQAAAWASAPTINTGRYLLVGVGATTNSTIVFGGVTNPGSSYRAQTESYDGTSWSELNDMNTGRFLPAKSIGTSAAALAAGGYLGTTVANSEEWDGSSWSNVTSMPAANRNQAGFGTQTAGVVAGGQGPAIWANVYHYDGSSWTSATSLPVAKEQMSGCGTQTAGLVVSGRPPSETTVQTVEEYDGSSWTAGGTTLVAQNANINAGSQTDAYMFTGYNGSNPIANTSNYDGTSWTANVNLGTAISSSGGSTGQGAGFSQIQGGGSTPGTPSSTVSQEFTAATEAVKTITAS